MPPVNHGNQKPYTGFTGSEYSQAQWDALETVKQTTPRLKYGAARAEFANKVMLTDGTISDDLDAVRAATVRANQADNDAWQAFRREHADAILDGNLAPELQAQLRDLRFHGVRQLDQELDEHIAENRFLFIVDADLVPRVYFQCAVPGNPDVVLADAEA